MSGQESVKSNVCKNGKINIYFSKTVCEACSFFQDCINANRKTKLTKRVLTVEPDHAFIQDRRIEQKTDNFKKEMRERSGTNPEEIQKILNHLRKNKPEHTLPDS